MIAHHQGDRHGQGRAGIRHRPEIRKLAEDIIKAQEGEIKQMKAWLARNGG